MNLLINLMASLSAARVVLIMAFGRLFGVTILMVGLGEKDRLVLYRPRSGLAFKLVPNMANLFDSPDIKKEIQAIIDQVKEATQKHADKV